MKTFLLTLALVLVPTFVPALILASAASIRNECSFDLNGDVDEKLPLLLKPSALQEDGPNGMSAYILPSLEGIVSMTEADTIVLACPGTAVLLNGITTNLENTEATCSSSKNLNVNGEIVNIANITCQSHPFHTARYTGNSCLTNKKEVEIGFVISETRFLKHMTICFDDEAQSSLYSTFDLPKEIGGYQSGYPRPNFIEDDFYNVGESTVTNLYTRNTQRMNINERLGLDANDTTYVHETDDVYIVRGHMTAKADFIYGTVQRATFHYINVVPQWQTNNGGNWATLELDVRNFASANNYNLVVYTGVYGVSTLPHAVTGEDVPLYLYYGEEDVTGLPVPEVCWKVAYHPETESAIALVTVNNPHLDTFIPYCTSVCDQVTWLNWLDTDQTLGFSYCCDVNELRKVFDNIPDDIVVSNLLV